MRVGLVPETASFLARHSSLSSGLMHISIDRSQVFLGTGCRLNAYILSFLSSSSEGVASFIV